MHNLCIRYLGTLEYTSANAYLARLVASRYFPEKKKIGLGWARSTFDGDFDFERGWRKMTEEGRSSKGSVKRVFHPFSSLGKKPGHGLARS